MTMTVKQLRDILARYPDDLEVRTGISSGDYWRTRLALPIREDQICEAKITWTEYHRSYKVDDSDESDSDLVYPNKTVLII